VLLHGGLGTVETMELQTRGLAASYRVIVPERRGHGRTPDVAGPITYEAMAADTIAFLETLQVGRAHLVGWSDGAVVALRVALDRPDLVGKLVFLGNYASLDGARPEQITLMELMTRAVMPPRLEQLYAAVSPDGPDHFPIVFDKLHTLWRSDPAITAAELATLRAPTLVLIGDDDCLTIEHAADVQRAIPDAQLAIVPGTSHGLPMEKPDLVNRIILDFLQPVQVPKRLVLGQMLAMIRAASARPTVAPV
jgi:pimeloyl-ACP methyl ester carboxylesterase